VGRPGPRPVPSAIRRAKGVRPDRLNPAEPTPVHSGCPSPPPSLGPEAAAIWHRQAPDLHRWGVLTPWDVETFAAYCDLVVQANRARQLLVRGLLAKGRRDPLVVSPAWRIYRDALVLLRLYAMEFGLTPSARSQLRGLSPPPALSPGSHPVEQSPPALSSSGGDPVTEEVPIPPGRRTARRRP
jgi:P27 family predicted phage terminase small subunit